MWKGVEIMATANVTIRMDEGLKRQAERMFRDMGMNMTTAITIFAKTVVKQGKIPFEISVDPFWSEENQARLRKSIAQLEAGQVVIKTMEELEAMADE
jgi:DNA-damage-inducible protein J